MRARDRRILIVALIAAMAAVLIWRLGGGDEVRPAPEAAAKVAPREVAGPVLAGGQVAPPGPGPELGPRRLPPPPPDFDPGSEAPVARGGAERKLAQGEFPVRPPGFASAAERAKFRAWWMEEYGRRTAIYRAHHASDTYPSDEDAAGMLERLYDLGEPPRAGETAEDLDVRQQAWFEAWSDLTAAYGTPPKTVLSFGGDPQYGTGKPPPVVPPGAEPPRPDDTRPTMPEGELPEQPRPLGPARPR